MLRLDYWFVFGDRECVLVRRLLILSVLTTSVDRRHARVIRVTQPVCAAWRSET